MPDQVSAWPMNSSDTAMIESTASKISVRISATPFSFLDAITPRFLSKSSVGKTLIQRCGQKIVQNVWRHGLSAGVAAGRTGEFPGIKNVARRNVQQRFRFILRYVGLRIFVLGLEAQ